MTSCGCIDCQKGEAFWNAYERCRSVALSPLKKVPGVQVLKLSDMQYLQQVWNEQHN